MGSGSGSVKWSFEEDKAFERALIVYPEKAQLQNRWELIAELLPGKTVEDVKTHYVALLIDLDRIESGQVPMPLYKDDLQEEEEDSKTKRKKRRKLNRTSTSGRK